MNCMIQCDNLPMKCGGFRCQLEENHFRGKGLQNRECQTAFHKFSRSCRLVASAFKRRLSRDLTEREEFEKSWAIQSIRHSLVLPWGQCMGPVGVGCGG